MPILHGRYRQDVTAEARDKDLCDGQLRLSVVARAGNRDRVVTTSTRCRRAALHQARFQTPVFFGLTGVNADDFRTLRSVLQGRIGEGDQQGHALSLEAVEALAAAGEAELVRETLHDSLTRYLRRIPVRFQETYRREIGRIAELVLGMSFSELVAAYRPHDADAWLDLGTGGERTTVWTKTEVALRCFKLCPWDPSLLAQDERGHGPVRS